jgi:hypothetical protein
MPVHPSKKLVRGVQEHRSLTKLFSTALLGSEDI